MNLALDPNLIVYFGGQFVPLALAPVVRVDHCPVGGVTARPLTLRLRRLYFDAAHEHLPAYRKPLLPAYEARQELPEGAVHLAETNVA